MPCNEKGPDGGLILFPSQHQSWISELGGAKVAFWLSRTGPYQKETRARTLGRDSVLVIFEPAKRPIVFTDTCPRPNPQEQWTRTHI